jgi:hypothetical protein
MGLAAQPQLVRNRDGGAAAHAGANYQTSTESQRFGLLGRNV